MGPKDIEDRMDGGLRRHGAGRAEAFLPSPRTQNHAAFLSRDATGLLHCAWFGGSLEGRSDICIHRASLHPGACAWTAPEQLTGDPDRSEQNPVLFHAPDGRDLLFHTAQPGGRQDECLLRMRVIGAPPRDLPLPTGTFIRAPVHLRDDGAWLLPLFLCTMRPGQAWTGSHDTAALAISTDNGESWRRIEVPDSIGCVHMTIVSQGGKHLAAFFRRRQADFVFRSESLDGGESWSAPAPTDVPNNNSSISVIALRGGGLAMACNPINAAMHPGRRASLYDELVSDDRSMATGDHDGCTPVWGVKRAPMTVCLSSDGGHTFPRRIIIEDGPGTCLSNDSLDGRNLEMSYPALSEGPDGTLDLAYTYRRRAIKHVRLSPGWQETA